MASIFILHSPDPTGTSGLRPSNYRASVPSFNIFIGSLMCPELEYLLKIIVTLSSSSMSIDYV
jgi:hypothetical protein